MIADCEWSFPLDLVTGGDPAPPIEITSMGFFLSDVDSSYVSGHTLGAGTLMLTSGQTGSATLNAATDPVEFAYFTDLFTTGSVYLAMGIGTGPGEFFGLFPWLQSFFTPEENQALEGAELAYFRIIVDEFTIVNDFGGDPTLTHIASSGRFEIWTPTPGTAALLAIAGLPLGIRRRRHETRSAPVS
jgi:hypothetical protein